MANQTGNNSILRRGQRRWLLRQQQLHAFQGDALRRPQTIGGQIPNGVFSSILIMLRSVFLTEIDQMVARFLLLLGFEKSGFDLGVFGSKG